MNPLNPLEPVAAVVKAVTFPITAIFVVGICYLVNLVTSPHHWWAQWVLFGMAIATLVVWMRALRMLITSAGIAGGAYLAYRWWTNRQASSEVFDAQRAR